MAYSTQAQIEAIIGRSLTASEITLLSAVQLSADNWINQQTDQTFGTGSTTRYYDGGGTIISIDPVRTISSVTAVDSTGAVAQTYTDGTDYVAGPLNDTIKTYLEKRAWADDWIWWDTYDTTSYPGRWPSGAKRLAVTGTFTYGDSVPADISYLSAYLSAKLYTSNETLSGTLQSESIEGYSRQYATAFSGGMDSLTTNDATVSMILENYSDQEILF